MHIITQKEQIIFLQKLIKNELSISKKIAKEKILKLMKD